MKERIKELGEAINATLANSDQIAEVIARIKDEGYDVFLVLEATVGFNRRDGEDTADAEEAETESGTAPELEINPQDLRFLKALRIAVDDDNQGQKAA
jgi:pyruvate/2-oxoacid:ferredoxin oxidoreductase beta subunit